MDKKKFMNKKFWTLLLLGNILWVISIGIYFVIVSITNNLADDMNIRMATSLAYIFFILFTVVTAFADVAVFGTYLFWRLDKKPSC